MINKYHLSTFPCTKSLFNGEFVNNPVCSVLILFQHSLNTVQVFKAEESSHYGDITIFDSLATIDVPGLENLALNKIPFALVDLKHPKFEFRFCDDGIYAEFDFIEFDEKNEKFSNLDKMLEALESILLLLIAVQ